MTQKELTLLNLGDSLDNISNIDPRGYGVCHILYPASREYTGGPLCMNAAGKLCDTLKQDDLVYIMTGFVLPPFGSAETDGVISSVLLARSLVIAFGAKPVIVCQEENVPAVKAMAAVVGLHLYESIDELKKYPISMAVVPFTKDKSKAESCADEIISHGKPAAVISIEAPGENKIGKYHNATGLDVTDLGGFAASTFKRGIKFINIPTTLLSLANAVSSLIYIFTIAGASVSMMVSGSFSSYSAKVKLELAPFTT